MQKDDFMMADITPAQNRSTRVALTPALPATAACPLRFLRTAEGLVAAYNPAEFDRLTAWQILVNLFGPLLDVTPAVTL